MIRGRGSKLKHTLYNSPPSRRLDNPLTVPFTPATFFQRTGVSFVAIAYHNTVIHILKAVLLTVTMYMCMSMAVMIMRRRIRTLVHLIHGTDEQATHKTVEFA